MSDNQWADTLRRARRNKRSWPPRGSQKYATPAKPRGQARTYYLRAREASHAINVRVARSVTRHQY
eukprot:3540629-Alexandrium_andersonii.AAC.1